MKRIFAAAVAACLLSSAANATIAVTISNTTGQTLDNPPFTLGWIFTANSDLVVDGLGLFDSSQNGFAESHEMGLWTSSGTLLASTTIAAGASGTLVNQFRYNSIAPTFLAGGQDYLIGALFSTASDTLRFDSANLATDPAITYINSRYGSGSALTAPTSNNGFPSGFFGPNFSFNAVPEPSTWAMMIAGFGFVGGAMRYRRRSTSVSFA